MRAALYCRVSTAAQEPGTSLESQRAACLRLAAELGADVVAEYQDVDSGAKERIPGLLELTDAAARGEFDVVLVDHPDRFSRDLIKKVLYRRDLLRAGVTLRYVSVHVEDSAEGRMFENLLAVWSEYERERITFRTNRGRWAKATKGEVVGTGQPPYGYTYLQHTDERTGKTTVVGYALDPEAAPIMRRVFLMLTTASTLTVAAQLNAEGIAGPRGGAWVAETILDMARNPAYKGQPAYGRRQRSDRKLVGRRPPDAWVSTTAPAIVDVELWERVQESLQARRRYQRSARLDPDPFLLRGCVRCGHCDGALACETRHGHRLYGCQRRIPRQAARQQRAICDARPAHAESLEAWVWTQLVAVLLDPDLLQRGLAAERKKADRGSGTGDRAAAIERDLWRYRTRLRNANNELLDAEPGSATYDDLRIKRDDAQRQITRLEAEQHAVTASPPAMDAAIDSLRAYAHTIAAEVPTLDAEDRRAVYGALRIRVTVRMASSARGGVKLGRHRYTVDIASGLLQDPGSSGGNFWKSHWLLIPVSV